MPPWEELARFVSSSFAPRVVLTPPSSSPSVKILDIPLAVAFRLGPRPARALWYVVFPPVVDLRSSSSACKTLISSSPFSPWSLSCSLSSADPVYHYLPLTILIPLSRPFLCSLLLSRSQWICTYTFSPLPASDHKPALWVSSLEWS